MTSFPDFYHPDRVGTFTNPQTQRVIQAGQDAGFPAAQQDTHRIILLLVDPQVDFIHADGALSVPGAIDDARRTIEWVLRHAHQITTIAASLDSHIPNQIFFPTWWTTPEGTHPDPFTVITGRAVDDGHWQPVFAPEWSRQYVHHLEQTAKKELMIWPYHTMIGTPGHAISPALYEAIAFHAAARDSQPVFLHKGEIPRTEHYSLLEPEVKVPNEPQGDLNVPFLEMLTSYDTIYVAGQAKSHCVLETLASVMRFYANQPHQIVKWRVLVDCMSSVAHPRIDFDALAEEAFARYAKEGLQLVTSTDPLW